MIYFVAILILVVFLAMLAAALYSFHWAAQTGQLEDLQSGAESIFDQDEAIGQITDVFPDRRGLPIHGAPLAGSVVRRQL